MSTRASRVPPSMAVAGFDSAAGFLKALGRFLEGRDFPLVGNGPAWAEPLALGTVAALELLPRRLRQELYAVSGWAEALPPLLAGRVVAGDLARWIVQQVPERRYPAVLLGSSNGAAMHLAAALGVPWLPQTLLLPMRQRGHPDDPDADRRHGVPPASRLLDANPELQLHHMHDPNQDRLMIRGMTYFRVKFRRLPPAYRQFLDRCLEPGGTVLVVDCGLSWPTTTVGERHHFQHGAFGGLGPEDYQRRWGGAAPDRRSPEAEWGYETALDDDLGGLGRRVRWLRFEQPEDLSPVVAELHRRWYGRIGRPTGRLLAESFIAVEPHWAQRTASAPYWLAFTLEASLGQLGVWLDQQDPFDEIRMTLFPHGVSSDGVATPEHWRAVLDRARKVGALVGSDADRFPHDFGSMVRYRRQLAAVRHRFALPEPLGLAEVEDELAELGPAHGVELSGRPRPTGAPARRP